MVTVSDGPTRLGAADAAPLLGFRRPRWAARKLFEAAASGRSRSVARLIQNEAKKQRDDERAWKG